MLARLLEGAGITVDVLSRGYGRGSGVAEEVDAQGRAERFGDEPLEMARAGFRIFVGAERFEAGSLAESTGDARVHLLDDGFQHRRLARALDVVLLTQTDVEDVLLPAGNLREGTPALRRADVVMVREEEFAALQPYLSGETWVIRRRLVLPGGWPQRLVAFCGIARPEGFFGMLEQAGCELTGRVAFADHHPYTTEDYQRLVEAGRHAGTQGFVTTAKDAVKIGPEAWELLESVGPLHVAELRTELLEPGRALRRIKQVMGE